MSDFKAKTHQIRFRLELRPDPAGGAYSAPPDSLAGFDGPTSKGGEERKEGRGGEGREGGKRRGRGLSGDVAKEAFCLKSAPAFSLSSRLPPLLFRTTSVLRMIWCGCGTWPRSWRLGLEAVSRRNNASARSRLGVGAPRPRLGLELWRPWSQSRLCLD